jgi:hypothetical protein
VITIPIGEDTQEAQ